jgi:hypothetical protein
MKITTTLCFLAVLMGTAGCSKDGIPVLGLDDNNKLVEIFVKDEKFQEQTTKLIDDVTESTMPVLKTESNNGWMLRTAVVGLGLKFEAGFGPFKKASAAPRVYMAFSNSKSPVIP